MTAPHERPATGPAANRAARMSALIPVIETERLRLRAPRIEDFDAYAEIACSERGIGIGGPMTRDDAWADFIQLASTWLLRGHGGWTVEPREGGDPLGFVLIGFEPGDQEPELGFMFRAKAEGKGYAFEAATAARDFGFNDLSLPAMVSYVFADNTRSRTLAQRLGAARDAAAEAALPAGATEVVYRHMPSEARP